MSYSNFFIPGYDAWKTTPPEDSEEPICKCNMCGGGIYEGEECYNFGFGFICESCKDDYVADACRYMDSDLVRGD